MRFGRLGAVALDADVLEAASVLDHTDVAIGTALIWQFSDVKYRLACTATLARVRP